MDEPGEKREIGDVLRDHLHLREQGDLEADIDRNYSADVVMLTPVGSYRGHDGVRECAAKLYEAIRDASTYNYDSVVCDDRVALLEWSANGETMSISDGVDTFLIEDGLIYVQTIRYTVVFSDLSQALNAGTSR